MTNNQSYKENNLNNEVKEKFIRYYVKYITDGVNKDSAYKKAMSDILKDEEPQTFNVAVCAIDSFTTCYLLRR
jgi:archaellum biogenesis ATPase FlaH